MADYEPDADTQDFQKELDFINNAAQSVNILDQLPSYNYVDTEIFINNISKELEQQKTINNLLQSNDETVRSHIEKIKAFADANGARIDEQLAQLKAISSELKELITTNAALKEQYSDIDELTTNEAYINIARNIQEIKQQKQDILDFLKNFGIIAPPLSV
jgi:methyl-accepting chemotaxis protein